MAVRPNKRITKFECSKVRFPHDEDHITETIYVGIFHLYIKDIQEKCLLQQDHVDLKHSCANEKFVKLVLLCLDSVLFTIKVSHQKGLFFYAPPPPQLPEVTTWAN